MFVPALLLLGGAVAIGAWYGMADLFATGAHRFTESGAYAEQVLHGRAVPVPAASSSAPEWFDWLYAAAATAGAFLVAAVSLWGSRLRAAGVVSAMVRPLQRLHSGRIGDYTAWLALGAGAVTALMTLTR